MKRILVDTNVLISFLTDRNFQQQAEAAELFEQAVEGAVEINLHQMVISEMVYVLANLYQTPAVDIAEMIDDLLSSPGVKPMDTMVWSKVLELWPSGGFSDFADAALAAVAIEERQDAIATFDRAFGRQMQRLGLSRWTGASLENSGQKQ